MAIDIETGTYEVDANELAASDRLLARVPNAQIWLRRIGFRYTHRFGFHPPVDTSMIVGVVTDDRQAVMRFAVPGPAGQETEIDAIIDTVPWRAC